MKDFVEKTLHQEVGLFAYKDVKGFPLVYQKQYRYQLADVSGTQFLIVEPLQDIHLPTIRKQYGQIAQYAKLQCALYLRRINYYAKDVLVREGIPFIWEGHQIYLPFLGIMLAGGKGRTLHAVKKISFLTQKLLLTALYETWDSINTTKAAEKLGVTKTSISRCFDELEVMGLSCLSINHRARKLSGDADKRAMWEMIRPKLRNPLLAEYEMNRLYRKKFPLSGMSALSQYSMLGDNQYPTFGIMKSELSGIDLGIDNRISPGEEPVCVFQELGYRILGGEGTSIDPLTVTLLISEEDKQDPRVEQAIEEMLEEYVW